MTDKHDLIRIMEVYEDTTGTYNIGEIDWSINTTNLKDYLQIYGKKDIVKCLKKLIKKIKKINKEIKK